MCRIFRLCVQLSIQDRIANDVVDAAWSWIQVSYVCSEWRKVALGCEDLWRYIDFSHSRPCAITLERAKMSPLHIHTVVSDSNVCLVRRTLQLAHRIQDIRLRASLQHIYPLLELLSYPNPAVKSLVVDVHIPKSRPFGAEVYGRLSVPTCGPPLENLRYMELRSAPFYLLTPRCTQLTQLHIHDLPTTERPTLRNFLTTLDNFHHLEHLTLDRSFPINIDMVDVQSLERRVILPKLKSISVIGSLIETANLLACFVLPPSARLISRMSTLADLKNNLWRLSQWLSSYFSVADDLPLEMLVLAGQEAGPRFIEDTFDPNPDFRQSLRIKAFRADCVEAAIDLTFEPCERDTTLDDLLITSLTSTLKALPLAQIHTLAVRDIDFVTQRSWSQLLREIPFLRVLDITGRAPSGLAWALLLNSRLHNSMLIPEDSNWGPRLFVPRLNDIYLHRVDCSSGGYMISHTASVNSYFDLDDSRFLDVLNASICERRQLGLSLRSLSLDRCEYVMSKSIDNSRRLVSHLICDIQKLVKDGDVDDFWSARYRGRWNIDHLKIAHYYRLYALAMDSDD